VAQQRNRQANLPGSWVVKEAAVRANVFVAVGIVLVVLPFLFLLVPAGLTFAEVGPIWAVMWIVGYALAFRGIAIFGRLTSPDPIHIARPPGGRLAVAAGVFLLIGFLTLVAAFSFVSTCQTPCIEPNGVSPGVAAMNSGCGTPCVITVGPTATIGPVQVLIGSFTSDAIGVLFLIAAGRTASASASRRKSLGPASPAQ
jgi:hypothetical protein